jgi:dethiobiotin synthetase
MSAYFIASTGTGVGKTFTTCALLHAARMCEKEARACKPVISGWDEADSTSDVAQIIRAGDGKQSAALLAPWRFAAPLSPHLAAAAEGRPIDPTALLAWSQQWLEQDSDDALSLIEGVGGVMVPLTEQFTTLDWMEALGLPVILVVGSYLGSISHTLTTLEVLRTRNLPVAALVLNESHGSSVTLAQAHAGLTPFIRDIALQIVQPRVSSWQEARAIHAMEL